MATTKNGAFEKYLQSHNAGKGEAFTHTRIGDKTQGMAGGSYKINETEWNDFMKHYYQHVFVNGNLEYLTEKQLEEDGPIMIDIDLRYDPSVSAKQHTTDHIVDAVMLYADKITELVDVSDGAKLEVFVMEKKNVNKLEQKTKDGIHIIFGLKMHKALQVLLRKKIVLELKDIWEGLPITNPWEEVLDEGVTKGFSNWQMYGSRKPSNEAYMIKYHYAVSYVNSEWEIEENPIAKFSVEKNLLKLSARYTEYPSFPMKEGVHGDFEAAKLTMRRHTAGTKTITVKKHQVKMAGNGNKNMAYQDINSETMLDEILDDLFEEIPSSDYRLKETHQYTLSLPLSYYGPGSYSKWIRVGMALHNTHPKLFLTWLKFSCQENCRDTLKGADGKFDWRMVPELYETWQRFSHNNGEGLTLTYRSIMYWSKNDVRDKYNAIRRETVDFFISQTFKGATDFDLAAVLYNMYKDKFVCVSIKHKVWYEYINHRWHEIDSGNTLRLAISKEMFQLYNDKLIELNLLIGTMDGGDPKIEDHRKNASKIAEICLQLKKTQPKQNIMREACELFYDKDFFAKLDKNPYLLCFNNGVVDFKQGLHRKGQPDDFISKCTNIDYIPYQQIKSKPEHTKVENDIKEFMKQLFPVQSLETYMWDHLSSCLIGVNTNQTFHVYKGSGRNGKSVLTSLMSKGMGTYKGTVPITLITNKRNAIGSTSSEIAQLDGVRYAVMQEPSKGDKINEGTLKELTGGTDPIQGRALFKDTITFVPQFKLVVCTNTDFEDTSNDDGTWRRMRYIDFMAKFLEIPYGDEIKFPRSECPYQFPLDKKLEEKFEVWAPIFMAMLVENTYKNQGVVNDCEMVMANSDKHRESQDYFMGFAKDMIIKKDGNVIKKTELMEEFKKWYIQNHGKTVPKGKEVTEFMNKRYGICKGGWHNIAMNYDGDADPMDEL